MKLDMTLTRLGLGVKVDDLVETIAFEQRSVVVYGKTYPQPRLTKWYGPKAYTYSGLTWPAAEMPEQLKWYLSVIEEKTGGKFNSVLCNLYRDGRDMIHWHSDDEPEFGEDPEVASLSFGDTRTFRMRKKGDHTVKIDYELYHESLLFMPKGTQAVWEHTVPKTKKPVGQRVNLTFRYLV